MQAKVLLGDARDVLAGMDAASVDAIVTDPPAGIGFMGKKWDTPGALVARKADTAVAWDRVGGHHHPCTAADRGRTARSEGAKFRAALTPIFAECVRVLKPGHQALVWALPRTSHWTATALEDAGFFVADVITHHFGQGFPKGKGQLKPASEHWILCRAPGPLQPLQIDAARVATGEIGAPRAYEPRQDREQWRITGGSNGSGATSSAGRWPPNLVLSHHPECQPAGVRRVRVAYSQPMERTTSPSNGVCYGPAAQEDKPVGYADADGYESVDAWACVDGCPVAELDRQAGYSSERPRVLQRNGVRQMDGWGLDAPSRGTVHGDAGGKSRFFPTFGPDPQDAVPFRYQPKAPASERRLADGTPTGHPTQKPVALAQWLASLVCAPGGTILDPFAGVGSLGVGALRAGCHYRGIEQDAGYATVAQRRLDEEQEQRVGPLFAGVSTAMTAAR